MDKDFWVADQILNPMPVTAESTHLDITSKRWRIEDAQVLPVDRLDHLCETCRHTDFNHLVHSPLELVLEGIALGRLRNVVQNHDCAFCRLLMSTAIDSAGGHTVSTHVNGKDVLC